MTTVLVTGVGGTLAQAIIKSLRMAKRDYRIIGVNSLPWGAGLFMVDRGYVVPPVAEPEAYLGRLAEIIQGERVQAVIPGTHHDMEFLSKNAARLQAKVIVSPPAIMAICNDKLQTAGWLEEHGFAFPETILAANRMHAEFPGFPCVVKPRFESGSRGVTVVHDVAELMLAIKGIDDGFQHPVIQANLDGPEYTVGGFYLEGEGCLGLVSMRRELAAGSTLWAEIDPNPDVLAYCRRIVEELKPLGPANIQLRLTRRGPVAFEINPRFSTTTVARAHFGFNEVDFAVQRLALEDNGAKLGEAAKGGFFVRHWDETYLSADEWRSHVRDAGKRV